MDIKSILKAVGGAVLSTNPVGAAALPIINALLPSGKKLLESSTGKDAELLIGALPHSQKTSILSQQIDLEIEKEKGQTSRYIAMCKADGQQTRARIVVMAMYCLIIQSLIFVAAVAYVYCKDGAQSAFSLDMAGVYLAVSGTFAYVIRAYFGDLKSETESRHATSINQPAPVRGIAGLLNALRK